MAEQTLTTDTQVERAVEGANRAVREHLAGLRAEHHRMTALLRARELDLQQLRSLVDDLSYASSAAELGGFAAGRWSVRLEELQSTELGLRADVETLGGVINQIEALISAVSSISELSPGGERRAGGDPLEAAIAGRMLQGQEAERSRLAREVHDGPAQVVANAIMALEYCERLAEKRPASVPDELRRIKGTMSEGLEEVRRFIFDLRPSSLEHEGLRVTVEKYGAAYQSRFGIATTVRCEDVDDVLTPEQRFVAFRVIQESMQNARKHALATTMGIEVRRQEAEVLVSVSDNGRGFDLEANRFREGHFGLQGMRERAESVQGSVVIFSEPGHGTEVRMGIPTTSGSENGR